MCLDILCFGGFRVVHNAAVSFILYVSFKLGRGVFIQPFNLDRSFKMRVCVRSQIDDDSVGLHLLEPASK